MTSTTVSQKEYIKRYLSKSDDKKKRKKKKHDVTSKSKLRIVDDDLDLSSMRPVGDDELELYNLDEDAPQVAGIIDERPEELRALEEFRESKRWKVVSDSTSDIKITELNTSIRNNLNSESNVTVGKNLIHGKKDDEKIPVKKEKHDSDESPPRKRRAQKDNESSEKALEVQIKSERLTDSDSDISVSRNSGLRQQNGSEHNSLKKHEAEQNLPHRRKGSYDEGKKKYINNSDRNNDKYEGEERLAGKLPRRARETLETVKKGAKQISLSEERNTDLSPPRSSQSRDREKHKKREVAQDNVRTKGSRERSDSDLSPPRPTKSKDKEINKKHSGKEKRRKNRQSEDSDSDLSLPRPSKSRDKERNKKYEDGKEKRRKNRQSEDSDSDLSLPRASTSRTEKHKRHEEVKERHRRGWPNEEKDKSRYHHSSSKDKRKKVKESSEESDSGSSRSDTLNRHTSREKNKSHTKPFPRNGSGSESLQPRPSKSEDARSEKQGERSGREGTLRRDARDGSSSPSRPPGRRSSRSPEGPGKKLRKTLDGKQAGLQDARQLRQELESVAEREKEMFSKMSDDVSGRLAEAVKRDRKTGKKRDFDEEARIQREKDEKDQKFKEKYSRWGKGLKQVEDQKQKLEEAMKVMAKPLARYADDQDLDKHLREQEREGDPMLDYIRSKKATSDPDTKTRPKYQGSYPTNRFGIPPGYRWDGVDRSSGYEKQWFEQRSAQKAREEEAYKWSTADM